MTVYMYKSDALGDGWAETFRQLDPKEKYWDDLAYEAYIAGFEKGLQFARDVLAEES